MFLVMPLFMAAFGFVLFKKMVWDLADAVYDYQDYLLFRKGNIEQKVFLKDIVNINFTHMSAPERVVVQVRNEGPIGKELAFSLPHRFKFFSKSPLVQELILRVDRAKNT